MRADNAPPSRISCPGANGDIGEGMVSLRTRRHRHLARTEARPGMSQGQPPACITTARRPVRTILPAVAAATVLPSFGDMSALPGCDAACAMIADKNSGKDFKSIQSNTF